MTRRSNGIFNNGSGTQMGRASKSKGPKSDQMQVAERAILDSDCIVTAMILGLCREQVGRKREIILTSEFNETAKDKAAKEKKDREENGGYRPKKDENEETKDADLAKLKNATSRINKALATTELRNLPPVKCGYAPAYHEEGAYITGKHHGAGLPQSLMKDVVIFDEMARACVTSEMPGQYTGRGAYTGVHTINGKTVFWGSTFRHYIPEEVDRWAPSDGAARHEDESKLVRPWGLIGGNQTLQGMKELTKAPSGVVGYTHGMIQAIYSAAFHGFEGNTIELAVGGETTKMASCFACTTFMCATGYPPDAIHLGRGESWAPVFLDSASIDELAKRFEVQNNGRLDSAVKHMNKKWHAKCASWLYWGTRINKARVEPKHQAAWQRVVNFAEENRNDGEKVANLFLDALTVHCSDTERVLATLVK